MKKVLFFITIFTLLVIPLGTKVYADESDGNFYPWRDHEGSFDFTFNNMIDTHQQSYIDKNGILHGFIYIRIIDVAEDGIPIAEKAYCEENADGCVVGWVIKAVPVTAELVNMGPRVWLMDPGDLPKEPGYTHFHWFGTPYKPHGLSIGTVYEGYLMKRMAARTFYWLGGSGGGQGGGHDTGEGGCSGHDIGDVSHTDEGGSDIGGGCADGEHDDDGCSGHDGGSGSSSHGGRLVVEGLDSHSNIITSPDEPWHDGECDD